MSRNNVPVTPKALRPGSKICIVAPATEIKPEYVSGATEALRREGFRVEVAPHALGPADGSFAASEEDRREDFRLAMLDPDCEAILCARGGYGCVHFIDALEPELLRENAKWVIGFSDVSALHAMMSRAGVRSIHSSMAKHLALFPADNECNRLMLSLLRGAHELTYTEQGSPLDIPGEARGTIRGGNLAVLDGLGGTAFDLLAPRDGEDTILFIEDIGEAIYRTERMVRRLSLSGALSKYKGIIAGQFTESRPDKNYNRTAEMLRRRLPEWGAADIPIAFDFPIGHTDRNLPIVEGAMATLTVRPGTSSAPGTVIFRQVF